MLNLKPKDEIPKIDLKALWAEERRLNDYLDNCVEYIGPFPYRVDRSMRQGRGVSSKVFYFPDDDMAKLFIEEDSNHNMNRCPSYRHVVMSESMGITLYLP